MINVEIITEGTKKQGLLVMMWCITAAILTGSQRDDAFLNEERGVLMLDFYFNNYEVGLCRKMPLEQ